jgi:1,2-diacylglycerol 3-beta-galactosyltransferase
VQTYPEGMHVIVKGFVNNMEQWMNACDMIITKAGPGTIAEAFICGLPVLLNAFIPCQEEGNIEYVVRNGTGIFSRDPQTIAATVEVRTTLGAWWN